MCKLEVQLIFSLEIVIADGAQNVDAASVIGAIDESGLIKASFARRRRTDDALEDAQFGDADVNCYYFLFPIEGGELGDDDGALGALQTQPLVSSRRVCIRACSGQVPEDATTQTAADADATQSMSSPPSQPKYSCENEVRFPSNCTDVDCDYRARWAYDNRARAVMFEIASRNVGKWTGIGWSRDGEMTNSDLIVGWVSGGETICVPRKQTQSFFANVNRRYWAILNRKLKFVAKKKECRIPQAQHLHKKF